MRSLLAMRQQPLYTRLQAGLLLKNSVRRSLGTFSPELVEALKPQLLQGVADPERQVRRTVGTCIATLAVQMGGEEAWLELWPVLVPTLAAGLDSGDPAAVDGCLDCLLKVCEDAPEWMAADATQPLEAILPRMFGLFTAVGLGRIVTLHDCPPTSHRNRSHIRYLCF